jgi:type IV secretion system protein VirD4
MMQQPLLSPDQIRTLRQGSFILMKTGFHPANFTLNFFTKWGICFNDEFSYSTEKRLAKQVQYATKISLEKAMND